MADGYVELDLAAVVELRLAASALEFSGVKLMLPSEISDPVDLDIEDAELAPGGRAAVARRHRPVTT